MMYNNKFVLAVKTNGKILREFKDTVYLPFGVEYSILLKNLNTIRAVAHIFLDGTDVAPGGIVINANSEVNLERWIKNGNLTEGNRFKFIERTSKIEQHRGIGSEDGLLRVEFQFEQPQIRSTYFQNDVYGPGQFTKGIRTGTPTPDIWTISSSASVNATFTTRSVASAAVHDGYAVSDVGITVPGSKSEQQFVTASWFPLESTKHVMILKLLGETEENKKITQPVTVKHKPKCQTCGKQNRANAKFCSECGTALEIFA